MGYNDQMGPMHYTHSRPPFPEPYGADNNIGRHHNTCSTCSCFPHVTKTVYTRFTFTIATCHLFLYM